MRSRKGGHIIRIVPKTLDTGEKSLCVIVPLTKMAGRFSNLESWLSASADPEMEIILVHDIQDSRTASELELLVKKQHHLDIKIIEGTFGSPGLARNAGLENSVSKWVTFWDSDDLPNTQNAFAAIANAYSETEVIIGNFTISYPGWESTFQHQERLESVALNPGLWRMIIRRTSLQGVSFCSTRMGEDQLFLIDLNLASKKIYFSDLNFYKYFQGESKQLTSNQNSVNEVEETLRLATDRLNENRMLRNVFSEIVLLRLLTTTIFRTTRTNKLILLIRYAGIVINTKPRTLLAYVVAHRYSKAERK